jgi:hypothetical protein
MDAHSLAPWRREYGVRTYGGHVEAKTSRHVAVREVERRIADGEKNVWLVVRSVTDWAQPWQAGASAV